MKKKIWLVMGTIGVLLFSGCGGKASDMMMEAVDGRGQYVTNSASDMYYSKSESMADMEFEETMDSATGNSGIGFVEKDYVETELYNTQGEKLIRTVNMSLQTKEFETLLSYLDGKVAELGGYIQNSQISGNSMDSYGYRYATLTLRIPQSKLDLFVSGVSENATVVRKSENAENVTLQYADTEARLKSLQIEQERFLALLEKADTVDSIIVLEEHLTQLRYEIESHASMLKIYDNKVDYSTVTLDISEVKRTTPVEQNPTLLTRMKDGFSDTWYQMKEGGADFLVWLVSNFLYLLIWGAIFVVVIVFVRKRLKLKKIKRIAAKSPELMQTDEEQNDRMDFKE